MRYNVNGTDELIFVKINSSEMYLIEDNPMFELIWENQFRWGTLSDWGQSDIGIDLGKSIRVGVLYLIGDNQILELIWENQFR